ncbi:hypothetical protein BC831DRAFT_482068, partial [Entophlyctis helioformis]
MCRQIPDFARSIRQLEEIISQQLASISSVLASTQGQQQQQQGVQIPQPQGQFQQGGQQGSQLVDQLMSSGIFQQLQTTNRDLSSSCSSLSAPACMRSTPSPATTAVVQAIAELKQQVAQQSQAISAALTNVGERTLLVEKVEKIRELTTRARAALQAAACATNEMYESQTSSILGSSGLVSGGACSNIGATASTSDVSSQVAGILGALGTSGNLGNLGNLGGLGGQLGGYGASIGGGEYGNRSSWCWIRQPAPWSWRSRRLWRPAARQPVWCWLRCQCWWHGRSRRSRWSRRLWQRRRQRRRLWRCERVRRSRVLLLNVALWRGFVAWLASGFCTRRL